MRAEVDVRPVRERRPARRRQALLRGVPWRRLGGWTLALVLALSVGAGLVFAGSSERIAAGVRVAGVNVAGLSAPEAAALLEEEAAALARVPVPFTVGEERFPLRPADLEARVDWTAVAAAARAEGDWPFPVRGLKRVGLRLFGAEVVPVADVYEARLAHELDLIAAAVDRPARDAAIRLNGLEPVLAGEREGTMLARRDAADAIVHALAGFAREPVPLSVSVARPTVTAAELEPVVEEVRMALSAPVRFGWNDASWSVPPAELAKLLLLPAEGRSELEVGGKAADRYFGGLARSVNRKPRAASFAVADDGETVRVVPSESGQRLDVEASGGALLAAALSPGDRGAELVVVPIDPELTTAEARELNVTSVLASYTTAYSGTADRIENLKRAAQLLDGTRLAPDATFSFNEVVGPRTEKRGFRPAPTIVNNEYTDDIGGGVSQVATTVFNAAWEGGLKIVARTAHSLYIDRYPDGRDATVNYPDVDLRFLNDTSGWLVVQGIAGETGITVRILGAPTDRRVESEAGPLEETGEPEVESVPDPTLLVGEEIVEDEGEPARSITVKRVVYEGDRVLYDESWATSYASEPRVVRVGTIPAPEEEKPKEPKKPKKPKDGGGSGGGGSGGGSGDTTTSTTP